MKLRLEKLILAACFAIFSLIATAAQAGPAVFWWHMPLNFPSSECVNRAVGAISTGFAGGQLDTQADSVAGFFQNLTLIVYCPRRGSGKSEAVIFSSGFDGGQTRRAMEQVRDGIRSGVFD